MDTERHAPRHFGFPAGTGLADPSADVLPLADRVATKILAWQAEAAPDRNFVFFNGQWVTYGEADRRANRVANALAGIGIKKGDRVAIDMRNRLEYLDLWFGLARIGAIQVPINVDYRSPQIAHTLTRSKIDLVVVEPDLLNELETAFGEAKQRVPLILLNSGPTAGVIDYHDLIERAPASAPPEWQGRVTGADIGAIMNTSGTTGPSKGVLMPHAQQYILGRNLAADMQLGPDDIYFNFYPMFHNTAQAMIVIPVLLVGAKMVLTERFSVSRFWSDIREHRCTAFYYIGEILRILVKSTQRDDAHGSCLRVGWGIGASPEDAAEFTSRFNVDLRAGYGSTEANVPCYLPHGSVKQGSAGCVVPGFEVRIADALGQPLATETVGEILVRSHEPCATMAGYDGDAAATAAAWKDLWLHTGDAGRFDVDGHLFFAGRIKDAIRVRGESVSAYEVESIIQENPAVMEVAAIAVPGELGGDDVKIVVVPRPGTVLSPESLVEIAQARLPKYAVPRYIEIVDALPKTATNKVMKHELRANPFSPTTWDRLAGATKPASSEKSAG
ncbi:AMP-binding protein [Sinorhizobium medicae]|uniref:AMP-binding protein n=1 Tax=Sinorhizobium medicae TaxID=110321 RepID=UPI001911B3CF|nr:AMP-binding protein [Sinorhizobium medicae]